MSNLTLWDIEKGIAELFDALEEADTPEAKQACEQALAEYFAREVVKVDAIRGLYKHFDMLAEAARQEANEIAERGRVFARRCESIKRMIAVVFEANPQLKNRLEGRTGRLLYKGNGGLAPLEVTDPAAVPDECCKYVGWISGSLWKAITAEFETEAHPDECKMERVVDQERVRAALKTCEQCGGFGKVGLPAGTRHEVLSCPACGGSGKGGVPGARLGERGKHVEVK